jgi:hypothetical protein
MTAPTRRPDPALETSLLEIPVALRCVGYQIKLLAMLRVCVGFLSSSVDTDAIWKQNKLIELEINTVVAFKSFVGG